MKISGHVQAIINAAYNEAKVRNHGYLTPEHILYAALAFEEVQGVLAACGANLDQIRTGMESYFEQKVPIIGETEPTQTVGFQSVIERAVMQSQSSQKDMLDVADILVSLFDEERNYCSYYLKKAGVKRFELLNVLSHGYDGDNPHAFDFGKGHNGQEGEENSKFINNEEEAHRIMLDIHRKGKGTAGLYPWDIALTKAEQVHAAAAQKEFPLRCIVEPV
jgi:ATP-dependent Clp protease ATP-binding subunit ClpA